MGDFVELHPQADAHLLSISLNLVSGAVVGVGVIVGGLVKGPGGLVEEVIHV